MYTWNPSDKTAELVLSNGDLTASHTATGEETEGVRGTLSIPAGKRYFDVSVDDLSGASSWFIIGACRAAFDLGFFGTPDAWMYVSDGNSYGDGAPGATFAGLAAGDVVRVYIDSDVGVWFEKNWVLQGSGDPVAGTDPDFAFSGETIFPYVQFYSEAAGVFQGTFDPSGSDVAHPPLTGFLPLDAVEVTPTVYRPQVAIDITVGSVYRPQVAIDITVSASYRPQVAIDMQVYDQALVLSGRRWRPSVRVGGVEIAGAVVGPISIKGMVRGARTATFIWRPPAGEFHASALINLPVEIDYIIAGQRIRQFTGHVRKPTPKASLGEVHLECSDGYQRRIEGMSREQIDAFTPGARYSQYAMPADAQGLDYLNERLKTLEADASLSPYGVLRLTPWSGLPMHRTYGTGQIAQGSLDAELVDADTMVNRVVLTCHVRMPVPRQAFGLISWEYDGPMLSDYGIVPSGDGPYYPPTVQAVRDAMENMAGWTWGGAGFQLIRNSSELVRAFGGQVTRRWVQDVTYTVTLVVHAPGSEAVHGTLERRAESSISLSIDEAEWVDHARVVTEDGQVVDMQAIVDSYLQTKIAVAAVNEIKDSHVNRVPFQAALDPLLDLGMECTVNHQKQQSTGRVVEFEKIMYLGEQDPKPMMKVWLGVSCSDYEGVQVADAIDAPVLPAVPADPATQIKRLGTQVVVIPVVYEYLPTMPDWNLPGWNAVLQNVVTDYAQSYAGGMSIDAEGTLRTYSIPVEGLYTITGAKSEAQRAEMLIKMDLIDPTLEDHLEIAVEDTTRVAIQESTLVMNI